MERRRNAGLARNLRDAMTDAEMRLWQHLRNRRLLGFKFRRQVPIGECIADFACPEARLIVELDGGQHVERAELDALRTRQLGELGFRVVRFWNDDVFLNLDTVLEQIVNALGGVDASGKI